jgi:hypothetical protein
MKNLQSFEEFINESKVNEALASAADVNDGAVSLKDRMAEIEEITADEPDYCDLKTLKKQYEVLSKALRATDDKIMIIDSESDAYDLVLAYNIGLRKRRDAGDANVKVVGELRFNSAWDSRNSLINATHYHIVDGKFDVITFMDGDGFADFYYAVYLKPQEKNWLAWGNKNMTEDDTNN